MDRQIDVAIAPDIFKKLPCVFSVYGSFSAEATMWGCQHQDSSNCYPSNDEAINHLHSPLSRYSTDIGAAFEAEIERRGLWEAYTIALVRQVRGAVTDQQMIRWLLIRAAPFDRCRAALAAVKGEGDGK